MNSPVSKSRDLGSLLKDPFTLYHDAEWNTFRSDTPADNLSELTSDVPFKNFKLDTEFVLVNLFEFRLFLFT